MSITRRVKRLLGVSMAGAMVLALMPAGIAAADMHLINTDDVAACDLEGFETPEFDDVLGFFADEIECMAAYGVTVGDADGNFNSPGSVTRQQMALFIARLATQALVGNTDIPATTDDEFDDIANVNPPEARDAINLLASLGIVEGVGEGEYDPSGTVTREQMASFIARAHVALEVDFDGFAATPGVFGDEDEISDVHLDNVLLLADVGVVAGRDGNYLPDNPVTRGQMSAFVVRSIGVLQSQGLWNGEFVVEPDTDALAFTVVDDGLTAGSTLDAADGRDDLGANENLIALSDGEAVTNFQFSVPEDDFNIDGAPATPTAFLGEVVEGATLTATPTATGFSHDISAPETVLEGTVGNGTNADTNLAIVDAPSGLIFTEITGDIALGQLYTVDGVPANQATFLANASIGDALEAEVLSTDAAGDPESFRHNLTNDTLEGTVVDPTPGAVVVDPNVDDDADAPDYPLYTLNEAAADEYVLDGEDSVVGDVTAALSVGDALTWSTVDGTTTVTLTNDVPVLSFSGITDSSTNTGGDIVGYIDGTTQDTFDYSGVANFRVDGVVSTQDEFEDAIDFGLPVGEAVAYDEDTDTISIVPALATPDLPIANVAAAGTSFDLVTADGLVIINVPTNAAFDNEDGDPTVARYFVNDAEVTQAVYESYLVDIEADADTDGDSFSAVVTDIATQHRLTTDNEL